MSDELQRTLDYEGKIDRGSDNIELLIADGRKRGREFLGKRAAKVGVPRGGEPTRGGRKSMDKPA